MKQNKQINSHFYLKTLKLCKYITKTNLKGVTKKLFLKCLGNANKNESLGESPKTSARLASSIQKSPRFSLSKIDKINLL